MNLAITSLKQVLIMFIMMMLGFLLTKLKLIDLKSKTTLSNILVYLVVPFMIINSYEVEFNNEVLSNLLTSFLLSFISLIIAIIVSVIVVKFYKIERKKILGFAMMFSNAAYMGLPLIEGLYGKEGVLYASAFFSIFNILIWTFGYSYLSKKFSFKECVVGLIKNPVIYALIVGILIFIFQIDLPEVVDKPIEYIGNMNTPLSMLITGIILANTPILKMLKEKYLYFTVIFRLIIIPFITLGILYLFTFLNFDKEVIKIIFVLASCPCASITTVFAVKFNYNEEIAASSVVISTLLSIITLPLFVYLVEFLIV